MRHGRQHHHHDERHNPVTDFHHNDDETCTDKHDHGSHHHHNGRGHILYCPSDDLCLLNDFNINAASDWIDVFGPADHNHDKPIEHVHDWQSHYGDPDSSVHVNADARCQGCGTYRLVTSTIYQA